MGQAMGGEADLSATGVPLFWVTRSLWLADDASVEDVSKLWYAHVGVVIQIALAVSGFVMYKWGIPALSFLSRLATALFVDGDSNDEWEMTLRRRKEEKEQQKRANAEKERQRQAEKAAVRDRKKKREEDERKRLDLEYQESLQLQEAEEREEREQKKRDAKFRKEEEERLKKEKEKLRQETSIRQKKEQDEAAARQAEEKKAKRKGTGAPDSPASSTSSGSNQHADLLGNGRSDGSKRQAEAKKKAADLQRKKDETQANGKVNGKKDVYSDAHKQQDGKAKKKKEPRPQKPCTVPITLPAPRPREAVINNNASTQPAMPAPNGHPAPNGYVPQGGVESGGWFSNGHTIANGLISRLGWSSPSSSLPAPAPGSVGGISAPAPPSWTGPAPVPNAPPPSWAQTWPAAAPVDHGHGLNPMGDPVFDPSQDPVFTLGGELHAQVDKLCPDDDPVFVAPNSSASFSSIPGVPYSVSPTSPFMNGMNGMGRMNGMNVPTGSLQADLRNGSMGSDMWNAPKTMHNGHFEPQFEPQFDHSAMSSGMAGAIGQRGMAAGTIGSQSWNCEQCQAKNHLGATKCAMCGWDRKAAMKLRMRQDLMAKMASNGNHANGLPNGIPNGVPTTDIPNGMA